MKEKGDSCILVGYSTQSKGYRVYNKRTRFIVESIHIKFDEIKEMTKTSVDNNTSGLVPQRQRRQTMTTLAPWHNYKMFLHQQIQQLRYNKSWIFFLVLCMMNSSLQVLQVSTSLLLPLIILNNKTLHIHRLFHLQQNQSLQLQLSLLRKTTHNQAEIQVDNAHVDDNKFYNVFSTPVREEAESSSRYVDPSNMGTFYQPHQSEHRWTKYYPLSQVRGNPSKPVQTRRQLETDPEMCMFALTVSTAKPKNIKEAMTDSAWIEAMQDELHQFDRLQVWELVDKPFGKTIIKIKWLWKNKKDEDQTVIHNKA
ncbi:retrovirus-related pol polyprotein from transposon TNT 1-94 [Tanacetum coccineum]